MGVATRRPPSREPAAKASHGSAGQSSRDRRGKGYGRRSGCKALARLCTHEDPGHIHKTLGLLAALHIVYRFALFASNGFVGTVLLLRCGGSFVAWHSLIQERAGWGGVAHNSLAEVLGDASTGMGFGGDGITAACIALHVLLPVSALVFHIPQK